MSNLHSQLKESNQQRQQSNAPRRGGAKYSITATTDNGCNNKKKKTTATTTQDIMSPDAIQDWLRTKIARQVPGSKKYYASWRNWCTSAVHAIRFHLTNHLPHPASASSFGELFYNLGQAADQGTMPSFANATARSGYALEFFCRARLIADFLLQKYLLVVAQRQQQQLIDDDVYAAKFWCSRPSSVQRTCHVLSLGGGPGYDYVGVLLADLFGTCGRSTTRIQGTVFDYEEGWSGLVEAMNTATNLAFVVNNEQQQSTLQWGGTCDITKPLLTDPSNAACLALVATTDVFICQYCVAENAQQLRESQFVFFRQLFELAPYDSIVILTEVTPRLWPDIIDLLPSGTTTDFRVEFCKAIKRSIGPQLMITKQKGAADRNPEDGESIQRACKEFRNMQQLHEKKIDKGFQRQARKVKGTKGG